MIERERALGEREWRNGKSKIGFLGFGVAIRGFEENEEDEQWFTRDFAVNIFAGTRSREEGGDRQ